MSFFPAPDPVRTPERPIIPSPVRSARTRRARIIHIAKNIGRSFAILLGATMLCALFQRLGFTDANLIMVYILGVMLTAVITSHRIYSLVSALASVYIFNYLFILPRFSLAAYDTGYPMTFAIMFLTAFITSTLALRYKAQAEQSAKIAYHTGILFETNHRLVQTSSREAVLDVTTEQITKLLHRLVTLYETPDGTADSLQPYPPAGLPADERAAIQQMLTDGCADGSAPAICPGNRYLYLPLQVNDRIYGAVGIDVQDAPLDTWEHRIVLSMLGECALALENERFAREKEAAAILAEHERLRANLLRSISHDLRTPLTAISGHASNLLAANDQLDEATRHQLYTDIHEEAEWLIQLVENLLHSTQIEDGRMILRPTAELLTDIVEAALQHTAPHAAHHRLTVAHEDELALVRADAKLMVQVLINLMDNAFKYTPPGSEITIHSCRQDNMIRVSVADNGPGISESDRTHIFEMFFRGSIAADSRRSLGLGLYLCKAIVEAHGGAIDVQPNPGGGCIFSFTLPREEAVCLPQEP